MMRILKYLLILAGFLSVSPAFSQNQDSIILKQIDNIDVSLNSPPDSSEDLYMNSVSFQSFYDLLSPLGEWIQVPKDEIKADLNDGTGEGYSSYYSDEDVLFIWKPKIDAGWKPYTNGRWEYTNHGWLWVSHDAWGPATSHYGRWWNSPGRGWVWLPGYTWAPAWVRWRVTDEHVGWVPLSPAAKWNIEKGITDNTYRYKNNESDWVFIEKNKFADDISPSQVISESMNKSLIAKSKKITDIRAENDRIINRGPEVSDIEKKTGKSIIAKDVKFTRHSNGVKVGDDQVTVYKDTFKKYDTDKSGKPIVTDKPKTFKKSKGIKRGGIRRRIRKKIRRRK